MTDKVIVADDNEDIRNSIAHVISRLYDAEVDTVSDGSSLIERVRGNVYSLVLTDNQMPGTRGLAAIRKIRKFNQEVPIYMLSESGVREQALELGATGYLDKRAFRTYGLTNTLDPILGQHLVRRSI